MEALDPAMFVTAFSSPGAALEWLQAEIQMAAEDGMTRDWDRMLSEPIRDPVVCLVRDGQAHIWDGFYRVAASVATGRSIAAIVGRPRERERVSQRERA